MRHTLRWVVCLAWLVSACDGVSGPSSITQAPLSPSRTFSSPHFPQPYQKTNWHPPSAFSAFTVGETLRSQVTADDPLCEAGWPYRCQFYRMVPPSDGLFTVAMTWNPALANAYVLDIDVSDPDGLTWDPWVGPGAQRQVDVRVSAGTTYWIGVWSFSAPGEAFELSSSLVAD